MSPPPARTPACDWPPRPAPRPPTRSVAAAERSHRKLTMELGLAGRRALVTGAGKGGPAGRPGWGVAGAGSGGGRRSGGGGERSGRGDGRPGRG